MQSKLFLIIIKKPLVYGDKIAYNSITRPRYGAKQTNAPRGRKMMKMTTELTTIAIWAFIKFNLLNAAIYFDNNGSIQAIHSFWGI